MFIQKWLANSVPPRSGHPHSRSRQASTRKTRIIRKAQRAHQAAPSRFRPAAFHWGCRNWFMLHCNTTHCRAVWRRMLAEVVKINFMIHECSCSRTHMFCVFAFASAVYMMGMGGFPRAPNQRPALLSTREGAKQRPWPLAPSPGLGGQGWRTGPTPSGWGRWSRLISWNVGYDTCKENALPLNLARESVGWYS